MLTREQRKAATADRREAGERLLRAVGPEEVQRLADVRELEAFRQGLSESPAMIADFFIDDMIEEFEAVLKRQFKRLTGEELTAETAEAAQDAWQDEQDAKREQDWITARYSDEEPPDTTTLDYGPPFAPDGSEDAR